MTSEGTHTVRIVKKKVLEDMEIAVPSLDIQKKIIGLYRLSLKEEEIMKKLLHKRKQFIEKALLKVLENG
jgi:restriction endonuclease S subunit